MAKRKLTQAERDQWEFERARLRASSEHLRKLAEKAQAKLDAKRAERERAEPTPGA